MRAGAQRFERGKVDVDNAVVGGVRVAGEGREVLFPALRAQKFARHLVGGEDGRGRAQFGAHVGDGGAFGDGERLDALAAPFDDRPAAAAHGEYAENFEAYILGADPRGQLAGEVDLEHARHVDVIGAAGHGHGHVHAARAHGQHAQRAAGGRVAVRADERLARLAEALQMHLMADAVAGAGEAHAVFARHGLDKAVVVGIFKAALEGVVVDIGHGKFGAHARNVHGFQGEVGHGAGGVLRERLVDAQADLRAGGHLAADEMGLDDLLRDGIAHVTSPPWSGCCCGR